MSMPGHSQILNEHWADILPLLPPQSNILWIFFSSAVLLFLTLSVVYFLWRRLPRQRALRRLRICQRQLHADYADTKQIGLIVYRSFMQAVIFDPVRHGIDIENANRNLKDFYTQLQKCVFQPLPPEKDELARLIEQACGWLQRGQD